VVDVPEEMLKFLEKHLANVNDLLAAMKKQQAGEPAHLEKLEMFERETQDTDEPMSEEDVNAVMQAHKTASPFALDVATAHAKLLKGMEQ
jgi:hypothetical protein